MFGLFTQKHVALIQGYSESLNTLYAADFSVNNSDNDDEDNEDTIFYKIMCYLRITK